MFTGIIEAIGEVISIETQGTNVRLGIESLLSDELSIDQSVSHNGVCLTVVETGKDCHYVTAIDETLKKSNLGDLTIGSRVNLERCTMLGGRLDGHIVQGHVDQVTECHKIEDLDGSHKFTFSLPDSGRALMVSQGSITIDGVSLTISDLSDSTFSVAIIPYTLKHTIFSDLRTGMTVNLEYDIIGKYVQRQLSYLQK